MGIDRYGIHIGPIDIRFYGLLIMAGVLAAMNLGQREARRRGKEVDLLWEALPWALVGGIAGARLWHVFTPPPSMVAVGITTQYYLTHPLELIAIWRGGLGIPGAVIGGVLALYLFTQRRGEKLPVWLDIVAPGIALAQAIGRWGNFVNQELYGAPSTLPWAITIEPQFRLDGFKDIATYHPLFLYESMLNVLNAVILLWLARRYSGRLKDGDVFLVYLIIYPLIRFCLDFLRLDASMLGGVNANQTFMVIVMALAAGALWLRHRPAAKPAATG
ncbi:MAG: prolipoprotein diacylglyceryl transferase [Anaerolineae bacterium]|nr:MAG: prolipoprotein diacylglyceryl transferase [Anaerolineae bacterium]